MAVVAAGPLLPPQGARGAHRLEGLTADLLATDPRDEASWRLVKEQFPLRSDLILMNAANLCPAPFPVIDAVERHTRDIDADASFQNRAEFTRLREFARERPAWYLGAESSYSSPPRVIHVSCSKRSIGNMESPVLP
jgi:hypothetical protein